MLFAFGRICRASRVWIVLHFAVTFHSIPSPSWTWPDACKTSRMRSCYLQRAMVIMTRGWANSMRMAFVRPKVAQLGCTCVIWEKTYWRQSYWAHCFNVAAYVPRINWIRVVWAALVSASYLLKWPISQRYHRAAHRYSEIAWDSSVDSYRVAGWLNECES